MDFTGDRRSLVPYQQPEIIAIFILNRSGHKRDAVFFALEERLLEFSTRSLLDIKASKDFHEEGIPSSFRFDLA